MHDHIYHTANPRIHPMPRILQAEARTSRKRRTLRGHLGITAKSFNFLSCSLTPTISCCFPSLMCIQGSFPQHQLGPGRYSLYVFSPSLDPSSSCTLASRIVLYTIGADTPALQVHGSLLGVFRFHPLIHPM